MTMNRNVLVICLLLMSVGAGCFFVDTPPSARELSLYFDGSVGVNNSTLQMQGAVEIDVGGGPGQSRVFENVTVTLYQGDGTPLCTQYVGSIPEDEGGRNVSISWPTLPKYVILDSKDFWQEPSSAATYYEIEDGEFGTGGIAGSRDEFPVDATNKSETTCNE